MNYIVLDLEWNQSPTGKERENSKIPFEIIEIGAVKLNSDLKQIDSFDETIMPKVYKYLHYKIKEISCISMSDLKKSPDFKTVINQFLNWCGEDYIFCTWGCLDLWELQRNMQFYKEKVRFRTPLKYLDIQKLFRFEMNDEIQNVSSLANAVQRLNIPMDRPFHRAYQDALYTAEVMKYINLSELETYYSIDCYYPPSSKKDQIYVKFPTYSKIISRRFSSKEKALMDKELTEIICDRCNDKIEIIIPWFSDNAKIYYSIGYCKDHGYIENKLKMRKSPNKQYYVIKIMKIVSKEHVELIQERQGILREKRKDKRNK